MSVYRFELCLVKIECVDRHDFCSQLSNSLEYVKMNLFDLKICPDCKSTKIKEMRAHHFCTSCKHQFFLYVEGTGRSILDKIIFQNLG